MSPAISSLARRAVAATKAGQFCNFLETRSYPRHFTFYVAPPACSILLPLSDLNAARISLIKSCGGSHARVASALARTLPTYSARNAIIGSTRLALRAGTQQARNAMPNKSKATHVNVIGSEVLTP